MAISTHDYNTARDMLIAAGSVTAKKSHPKHGGDAWPECHGKILLSEARDEFNKIENRTIRSEKRAVVVNAAKQMKITRW